jgi:hypothetical protein
LHKDTSAYSLAVSDDGLGVLNKRKLDTADLPVSGRPRTASTDRNTEKKIKDQSERERKKGVTIKKRATEVGIGQHTVQERRKIWDIGKCMPAGLLVF